MAATLALVPARAAAQRDVAHGGARSPARVDRAWLPARVPVTVSVTVAGRQVAARGEGECAFDTLATAGSPRVAWRVSYEGDGELRSLSLAVWRTAAAERSEEVSLAVLVDRTATVVTTFRGRPRRGGAVATVTRRGPGVRLDVAGRDASDAPVHAVVECARVTAPSPVGG